MVLVIANSMMNDAIAAPKGLGIVVVGVIVVVGAVSIATAVLWPLPTACERVACGLLEDEGGAGDTAEVSV